MEDSILVSKCGNGTLHVGLVVNALNKSKEDIFRTLSFLKIIPGIMKIGDFERIIFPSSIQSFHGLHHGSISGAAKDLCTQHGWQINVTRYANQELSSFTGCTDGQIFPCIPGSGFINLGWSDLRFIEMTDGYWYKVAIYNFGGLTHSLLSSDGIAYDKYDMTLLLLWQITILLLFHQTARFFRGNFRGWQYYASLVLFYCYMNLWDIRQLFWPVEFLESIGNEDLIVECQPFARSNTPSNQHTQLPQTIKSKMENLYSSTLRNNFWNLFLGPWGYMFSSLFEFAQKLICAAWAVIISTSTHSTLYVMNAANDSIVNEMHDNLERVGCNVTQITPESILKCSAQGNCFTLSF